MHASSRSFGTCFCFTRHHGHGMAWHGMAWHGCIATPLVPSFRRQSLGVSNFADTCAQMLMDRPASLKATMQASYGFEMSDTADGKFCVCGVAAGGVSAGKLQAGDEIVGVNGVDTTTLTHSTLVAHVSAGIRCELNIVRSANKRMRVNARGAVNIRTSISLGSTVVGRCEPGDTMEVFEEKSHVEDGTEYVRVRMETIPPRLSGWTTWKYQGQDLLDLLPALVAAGDAFAGGAAAAASAGAGVKDSKEERSQAETDLLASAHFAMAKALQLSGTKADRDQSEHMPAAAEAVGPLKHFMAAMACNPSDPEYRLGFADALLRQGHCYEAEQSYNAAVKCTSGHRAAFSLLRRARGGIRACAQAQVLYGKLERYLKEGAPSAGFAGHVATQLLALAPEMVLVHEPEAIAAAATSEKATAASASSESDQGAGVYKCIYSGGVSARKEPNQTSTRYPDAPHVMRHHETREASAMVDGVDSNGAPMRYLKWKSSGLFAAFDDRDDRSPLFELVSSTTAGSNEVTDEVTFQHDEHQHEIKFNMTTRGWYCDVCRWSSREGGRRRYRCVEGCDWDACEHCMRSTFDSWRAAHPATAPPALASAVSQVSSVGATYTFKAVEGKARIEEGGSRVVKTSNCDFHALASPTLTSGSAHARFRIDHRIESTWSDCFGVYPADRAVSASISDYDAACIFYLDGNDSSHSLKLDGRAVGDQWGGFAQGSVIEFGVSINPGAAVADITITFESSSGSRSETHQLAVPPCGLAFGAGLYKETHGVTLLPDPDCGDGLPDVAGGAFACDHGEVQFLQVPRAQGPLPPMVDVADPLRTIFDAVVLPPNTKRSKGGKDGDDAPRDKAESSSSDKESPKVPAAVSLANFDTFARFEPLVAGMTPERRGVELEALSKLLAESQMDAVLADATDPYTAVMDSRSKALSAVKDRPAGSMSMTELVDKLFVTLTPDADGCLSRAQLQPVFGSADPPLTKVQLDAIWELCDDRKAGKLSKLQVTKHLGLVSQAQAGGTLDPATLNASTPLPSIDGLNVSKILSVHRVPRTTNATQETMSVESTLLYHTFETNMILVKFLSSNQSELLVQILQSTGGLLASLGSQDAALPHVAVKILKGMEAFLFKTVDSSEDDAVLQETVDCMISLCRLHKSLYMMLNVMHKIMVSERLSADTKARAEAEIQGVLSVAETAAGDVLVPLARDDPAVQQFEKLLDPTPECCQLIAELFGEAAAAIATAATATAGTQPAGDAGADASPGAAGAVNAESVLRRVYSTAALLRFNIEAAVAAEVDGIDPAIVGIIFKALRVCCSEQGRSVFASKFAAFMHEAEILVRVAIVAVYKSPSQAVDYFFELEAQKQAVDSHNHEGIEWAQSAVLEVIERCDIASELVPLLIAGHTQVESDAEPDGRLRGFLTIALSGARLQPHVRRIILLVQHALLCGAGAASDGGTGTATMEHYSAVLFKLADETIGTMCDSVGSISNGDQADMVLYNGLGALVPTWLSAAYTKNLVMFDSVLPLLRSLLRLDAAYEREVANVALTKFTTQGAPTSGPGFTRSLAEKEESDRRLVSGAKKEYKTNTRPGSASGSYYGTFFEIKAGPKDIEITAICAASNSNYSSATATIHCYDGKPLNRNSRTLDRDSSSWKSVGRVRDLSRGRPTTGVLDAPVTIAAGTTVGFYIHCSTGNSSIAYDDSSSPQGNADVTLIPGRKTESSTPFHDISSSERIPVGGIVYNIKVAPVVTAHSYFRELPWIADLTKSVLSYVHSSCKAGIEESFSLASAGTEGGTDTTPSANHPPSIFDSFPILAGGVSDGHVSGSSSASLHALCEQIVANADGAKGKELLDLCSNNLPSANDPAVASVHRAAFATLVWHTQHLGDAALSWSQHGSNADELVDAYEAVGTTITGWFRDHRSSGGNQTADENDADGSGDDDVRIATLHRELSVGILERAALLLDLNSKCTRQIDATRARLQAADRTHSVSVESASSVDSVESDGNAVAETMKNKKRSKWKKVKSMFKLLRTARKQSSDIMQVAAAKEIISFLLPIGDVDGDDAASIRKSMQDAENKAAVFLNGFTAVMSALDTLPAQGRHAIHATLRAKICGQGFPHPLTNMTGIQVQSKLEVCRIHHGTCAKYDELVKSHCPLETC